MEKRVITKLADLEPVFIKDHFVCMFTGHELSSAYLIGGKYGSFYDPIIAATYLQSQLRKTINHEHFSKYQEMVAKDSKNDDAPFFGDIALGEFSDFVPGGRYHSLLEGHLFYQGRNFAYCLTEASDYLKKKQN